MDADDLDEVFADPEFLDESGIIRRMTAAEIQDLLSRTSPDHEM